jgi:hypothetical protein
MTVNTQGVSKTPRIESVILEAAGRFALSVGLSALGVYLTAPPTAI